MRTHRRRSVGATGMVLIAGITMRPTQTLAIVARHDRPDDALLALGERFPATGKIGPDGSCTLIAPTWVVTAGHVARSVKPGVNWVRFDKKAYIVKRVVMHPDCKSVENRPPKTDLALIELAEPVSGILSVPLYRRDDEKGKSIFLAGYGDRGDGRSKPLLTDGKLRAATNVVDGVRPTRILFDFSEPPAGTDLEGVSGPGDSGGPAFIEIHGKPALVGVSSAAMNGKPGRYGVTEVYTRISAFAEWIDGVIE